MSDFQLDATSRHQRRTAISLHPTQIGLDFIQVNLALLQLQLYFIPAAEGVNKDVIPVTIQPENILITEGLDNKPSSVKLSDIKRRASDNILVLHLQDTAFRDRPSTDRPPIYTLELINLPTVDRFFTRATFSLETNLISEFDSFASPLRSPEPPPELEINYLARDYGSFRQLMLDRLSVLMPQWKERHPADVGIALVEVLAYAADRLSYYQDAVATEAYLGTARQRISVRRHARLIDYALHEGCNARVWIQVQVNAKDSIPLSPGTQFLTRLSGQPAGLAQGSVDPEAIAHASEVFEALHGITAHRAHNEMSFYTWGGQAFYLSQGATRATLKGNIHSLRVGDILVFEERRGTMTEATSNAPLNHRHAVRLTRVFQSEDLLGGQFEDPPHNNPIAVTEIEWQSQDALPFPLYLSSVRDGVAGQNSSVALGNIVLAEQGHRVHLEKLPTISDPDRYQPRLSRKNLTYAVPYSHARSLMQPANQLLTQDPRSAVPMINLQDLHTQETWWAQPDLLSSGPLDRHFVVEMENDGAARLRFGRYGQGKSLTPDTQLQATYRIGNGVQGNIGHDAIAHVIVDPAIADQILHVRNPLPAQGGTDPEAIEQVRLYAPNVFHTRQERCATTQDYKTVAERHPDVEQAAALLRWTGSWYTAFIAVKRQDNKPFDPSFKQSLLQFMERYRLAGYDLEIMAPRYVPLDIAFAVAVEAGYFNNTVKQILRETFSNVDLPNGERGFFHPDHFTFGQSVYLSQLLARMMQIPGVARVEMTANSTATKEKAIPRFQPWGRPAQDELERGEIAIAPLSIARLDNDANAPERGIIEFEVQGGL